MRLSRAVAVSFVLVACGGEARKLGDVDVTGGSAGFDGFGQSGARTAGGGYGSNGGLPATGYGGEAIVVPPTGGTRSESDSVIMISTGEIDSLATSACAGVNFEARAVELPISVELLLDTSESMNELAEGGSGLSKWELSRDAVLDAIVRSASALLPTTQVGVILYPPRPASVGSAECGYYKEDVPAQPLGEPGSVQRAMIESLLLSVAPAGSTPTLEAHQFALSQVVNRVGRRAILLVTDGAPTEPACDLAAGEARSVDPEPIVDAIGAAYTQQGVLTQLVGSPDSDANGQWLSDATVHGGTASSDCDVEAGLCHIDLGKNSDLTSQLTGLRPIVGDTSCVFEVPESPGRVLDFSQVNVLLSSAQGSWLVLRDDLGDCTAGGWKLRGQNTIMLCPTACALAQKSRVEILFGCTTIAK